MPAERPNPETIFSLAEPGDDAELRALLWETPMEGAVRLVFAREPTYFLPWSEMQVIVARSGGRIVGVAGRSVHVAWVNGEACKLGHLGDLRLRPEYRRGTLLARGFRFLRGLDEDGRVSLYTTVIVDDNRTARRVLESGRAGLPRYTDQGRILMPAIRLGRKKPGLGEEIVRGTRAMLPAIVERLNAERGQFAPVYREEDFLGERLPGFSVEDFFVLRRGNAVAGVMGVWDQHPFRQAVVKGYAGWLRAIRPWSNLFLRPPLPAPGGALRIFHAAFTATDDEPAYRALLRRVYNSGIGGPHSHFVAGLHECDPRAAALDAYSTTAYVGRLYTVTFGELVEFDGRLPHVEPALL